MSDVEKDEEITQLEEKIGTLLSNKERTPDQEDELNNLKSERQSRYDKKIAKEVSKRKNLEYELQQARKQIEEFQNKPEPKPEPSFQPVNERKVKIGDEEFYTDDSLNSMIQAGKMTQQEAWEHQQDRIAAKAAERITSKTQQQEAQRIYNDTQQDILKEYPKFHPQHPDHDPNDPLYKEANRLLAFIDPNNPKRLRVALDEAKRNLKIGAARPDMSSDLGVTGSDSAGDKLNGKEKKVQLEEWEKDHAYRLYVLPRLTNPKTGNPYTEQEAYEKALQSKTNRASQMARR